MATEREKLMEVLFDTTVQKLLERINSGEATPSDLNVARQLLRDNGITATPRNKALTDLARDVDPADIDDDLPGLKFG